MIDEVPHWRRLRTQLHDVDEDLIHLAGGRQVGHVAADEEAAEELDDAGEELGVLEVLGFQREQVQEYRRL